MLTWAKEVKNIYKIRGEDIRATTGWYIFLVLWMFRHAGYVIAMCFACRGAVQTCHDNDIHVAEMVGCSCPDKGKH